MAVEVTGLHRVVLAVVVVIRCPTLKASVSNRDDSTGCLGVLVIGCSVLSTPCDCGAATLESLGVFPWLFVVP